VRTAGDHCVPLLVRALQGDERLSGWAYYFLARLGGGRVVRALHELLRDAQVADEAKALALALLGELHAPPPAEITLREPDRIIARSVHELVAGLRTRADLEQAADLVVAQIPDDEIGSFCGELLRHGGAGARLLVRAIATRLSGDRAVQDVAALLDEKQEAPAELEPEHRGTRREPRALDQGQHWLEQGDPKTARPLLRRFVRKNPEDAEGRSCLGICLLELGQLDAALCELEHACALDPTDAVHAWNLAAAAHKAGAHGRCYLALRAYLSTADQAPEAVDRAAEARAYLLDYERTAQREQPGVDPVRIASAESAYRFGNQALARGRAADAAHAFQRVVDDLPGHAGAWRGLAEAHLLLGERDQAKRCLERALQLQPGDPRALDMLRRS
jgi:Flp pilus assembly protein TadD